MMTTKTPRRKKAAPAAAPVRTAPSEPTLPVPASASKTWYIVLLVVSVLLLGVSAVLAASGTMSGLEQQVFAFINNASAPTWLGQQVAKPLSNAVWGMLGLIVLLLAVPVYRLRAWRYGVAATAAYALGAVLERIVARPRPSGMPYELVARAVQDGYGFPSSHVAVLTALGLTIWPLVSWPWRALIVVLVGVEAWARVFLGVHAPLDVVGGMAIGGLVVAAIRLLPGKVRSVFRLGS